MKKTVNINLAGIFFHIDEDAYGKLSRYLAAIRKSLSDPQGNDEIIRDIEARIAELFSEKIKTSTQVVSIKELDEVIKVMGQPEDYAVDEEIFEDVPLSQTKRSSSSYNQLFRDIDNKFISGVSSGLGHYLKIDAIWVRLAWVLLTIATQGFMILVYILFWILVPAAVSTSDKLKMTREDVTITNIEKKFKEGYEVVADGIKNADYDKYGQRIKKGTSGFFETVGSVFVTIFKIFIKLIGAFFVFIGFTTVISLIIGLFTLGSIGIWNNHEALDMMHIVNTTDLPIWLISLLLLFAIGVPFFALMILGLKILFKNLKSIGTPVKIILMVLWLGSLIAITVIGIRQATDRAYDGESVTQIALPIKSGETLQLAMQSNIQLEEVAYRGGGMRIKYNENDAKVLYSTDIRLIVRSTTDSLGYIVLKRSAEGASPLEARKVAEKISYDYTIEDGLLKLDSYFTAPTESKMRDQEIEVIVYLPEGAILNAASNTNSYHMNSDFYKDILHSGYENRNLLILNGETKCLDCPVDTATSTAEILENDTRVEKDTLGSNNSWEAEVDAQFKTNKKTETLTNTVSNDSI